MDPKLHFQLTGDNRGITLPSIALDPNRHLHEVSENRGNVLPSIFPHLQNQGAAASVDGYYFTFEIKTWSLLINFTLDSVNM